MALEGCHSCIKYLMFAFNFLFWVLGCVILGIGIWVKVDPDSFMKATSESNNEEFKKFFSELTSQSYESVGAYVLIVIGSIIMVIGFLGCCGAIRESQCMLATFFVFLSIIFVTLLAAGVYVIIVRDSLKEKITQNLKETIKKVKNGDETAKKAMGELQKTLKCCGADHGISDYGLDIKDSQCDIGTTLTPCASVVYEGMTKNSIIIGGVAIGIGAVMFLGMIFSMLLCCAIRENMA